MKYICHIPYNKVGASGKFYDIKKGEIFDMIGNFIAKGPEAICAVRSDDAFRYFARDDDGNGYKRGNLTHLIAFADRHNKEDGFRFSPEEREMLTKEYSKFLNPNVEFILFNYDFFNADVNELEELYQKLNK